MTEITELRELLSKRGVEWKSVGGTTNDDGTTVWFVNDMPCQAAEIMTGGAVHLALHISALTPEQAVAATLGSELNPDGLPNGLTISDDGTLLNWRGENYVKQGTPGGVTLTAEQVRETVEKHWHDLPVELGMLEATALPEFGYDWQAIADELNGLGSGTCELVETDSYSNAYEIIHVLECSACGETCEHVNGSYPRCPHCGAKAVER